MRGMIREAFDSMAWFYRQLVAQFSDHGLTQSAAALTYTTLFAVVPLMTVAYSILSVLPDFESVGARIQAYVFQNFVPESSAIVREKLADFSNQARSLSGLGTAFLVVTAFMMLVSVEKAFNAIWNVTESRRGLQRFLVYWGVLTCGPLLVVGGMLISSYLLSLPLVADMDTIGARARLLGYLPVLLSVTGFTVLYLAVPNCRVPFRHALVGGLFSMLCFEIAKGVFTRVVANTNMALIYGTFAAVPLFLAWVYFFWVLVLSGAILVRTLALPRDPMGARNEPPLILCLRILALLYAAHRTGGSVTDGELSQAVVMRLTDRERVFAVLNAMDLVVVAEDGSLMLGRDLRCVSLLDLYRRLPEDIAVDRLAVIEGLDPAVDRLRIFAGQGEDTLATDLDALFSENNGAAR